MAAAVAAVIGTPDKKQGMVEQVAAVAAATPVPERVVMLEEPLKIVEVLVLILTHPLVALVVLTLAVAVVVMVKLIIRVGLDLIMVEVPVVLVLLLSLIQIHDKYIKYKQLTYI